MPLTSSKKKTAAPSKTSSRAKRPPRQVWLTLDETRGTLDDGTHLTKKAANEAADQYTRDGYPSRAVGPYVLAERATER